MVGEKKAGIYRVQDLNEIKGRGYVLITAVSPVESDLVLQHTSINGKKILYTTGKDFGAVSISGEILLGTGGSSREGARIGDDDTVKAVEDWFNARRIGVSDEPVNVSAGGNVMKVYLVTFGLTDANAEFQTVGFTVQGITASPETRPGASA